MTDPWTSYTVWSNTIAVLGSDTVMAPADIIGDLIPLICFNNVMKKLNLAKRCTWQR